MLIQFESSTVWELLIMLDLSLHGVMDKQKSRSEDARFLFVVMYMNMQGSEWGITKWNLKK